LVFVYVINSWLRRLALLFALPPGQKRKVVGDNRDDQTGLGDALAEAMSVA
jgi:hypothetical protein